MSTWRRAIEVSDRQGGAIGHRQLRVIGLSSSAIGRRLRADQLFERHRAVYALGRPSLSPYGEACAAVLATNGRGALDGWSALTHAGMVRWPAAPEIVVVGGAPDLDGVHVRRTRRLATGDVWTDRVGLRSCRWPLAIVHLAARSTVRELQDALDAVERRELLHLPDLERTMAGARGRAGMPALREALEPFLTITPAEHRSLLERFARVRLVRAGLGDHLVNHPIVLLDGTRILVDIWFPAARVAVEVDGRATHERARQFAFDRRRDRELQKLDATPLRFTWQDVMFRAAMVVADVQLFVCRAEPGFREVPGTRAA